MCKKLFVIIITIPYYWDHRNNLQSPLIILMGSVYCWKEKGQIMMYDDLWFLCPPTFCTKLHWSNPLLICTQRFLHILPSMGSDWINLEPAAPIARHWLTTMQKIFSIRKTIGKALDVKRDFFRVPSATVAQPVHDPPVSGVERSPILASAKF